MRHADAIVVGSGPNGLAAAVTMARAGLVVDVIEGAEKPGGGCRTEELTLPGFHHDVCSTVHPLLSASPFFRHTDLSARGVTLLTPRVAFAHPLDGGVAAAVTGTVAETARRLGRDAPAYLRTFAPLVRHADGILPNFLAPLRSIPSDPLATTLFGIKGLSSAQRLASRFDTEEARAIVAGAAAHSMLPFTAPLSGAFGLLFTMLGHALGWPVVEGGSARVVDALEAELESLDGRIITGQWVRKLHDLPPARVTLLDVTPRQLIGLAGDRLSIRYRRGLEHFRYGPGVCKVDWALDGPVPWQAEQCRNAVTVHVGGTFAEVARGEADVSAGHHPEHPFCLVTQPCVIDPTRAPAGKHTLWAYCHVPNGSNVDMRERIEAQIERFAPGFRDLILAQVTTTASSAEAHNPSYVGGDIGAGAATLRQTVFRPTVQWNPYRTGIEGVYLCSASTPPGGGVHGMCGNGAARRAPRSRMGRPRQERPRGKLPAVRSQALAFAWYRFRATFGRRWGGLLSVVLLTGLLGGLSMGAIEAARTTESSPLDFATSVQAPEIFVLDGFYNPAAGLDGYNPKLLRTIAHLPHVEKVESEVGINAGPLTKNDEPLPASEGVGSNGSVDGLGFNEDRIVVTQGRAANPRATNEFVLDSGTARLFGLHLGETVTIGWVGNTQGDNSLHFKVPRSQQIKMKLVGIGAVSADSLFQDQDSADSSQIALFTPAFTRKILVCCSNDMLSAITLQGGFSSPYYPKVESELRAVLPKGVPFTYVQTTDSLARAERTLKPESIALGVFGGIAGLAALLIAGQVIGRRIRLNTDELDVLRALGADPKMTVGDGLVGTMGAVLLGTLLAGLVAVGLSPLGPLGPIGPLVPLALRVDWAVVGLGMAVLAVALGTLTVAVAFRAAPHRVVTRVDRERASGVARAVTSAGLPPAAVTGIRFALEPGAGRNAVPVRSAILGAVLAVVVVIATVTFGSSMNTLVSHPALYGWNWSDEINGGGGLGDIPAHNVARLLDGDPLVGGWTGVYFSTLQIDGLNVPVMGGSPDAAVGPPLLSGHAFDGVDQVVLGASTLAQLHKHVGDTVTVGAAGTGRTTLRIVGTATLPSIGVAGSAHLEMGTGALLSYTLIPPKARNVFDVQQAGPNAILVRFKKGANPAAATASLQSIVRKNPQIQGDGGFVEGVERPAEILNYRALGTTPTILGAALAAGAVIALALTLVSSVRRRRTDLALLKSLGFTRRQLASAIAWQASIAVGIGCVIGIPLGLALGRFLWDLFVHQINAVPDPTIPTVSVVLIAVGALILANLVAAVPGRIVANTPTAQLLRSE